MKIVRSNGNPILSNKSLLKDPSTRLRFSIWVIFANFILGVVCMILGGDLTALGVFLSMANSPLYVYVLGRTFRPSQIPDSYFQQQHGGAGGLGTIVNNQGGGSYGGEYSPTNNQGYIPTDDYNIPTSKATSTDKPDPVKTVKKDESEIG
jgi:uncharacterized membrane protein YgcG